MKNQILIFTSLLSITFSFSQESNKIEFDGYVDSVEWNDSQQFDILFEFDPGNNIPSPYTTRAYVTYDSENLLIGFVAATPLNPSFFACAVIGMFNVACLLK